MPEHYWGGTASDRHGPAPYEERMYPLTLDGLDRAMRRLKRRG